MHISLRVHPVVDAVRRFILDYHSCTYKEIKAYWLCIFFICVYWETKIEC